MSPLIDINPQLDRAALAAEFARSGRVQVRNVLTPESAERLCDLLQKHTPWLVTWCAGATGARYIFPQQLAAMTREQMAAIEQAIAAAGARGELCYIYQSYTLDEAFAAGWHPRSPHEQLRAELRGDPFAALLRDISGHSEIVGADGYATLYGPGHFLSCHSDEGSKWRRVAAFVLNMTFTDWLPDFGGYLTFYDDDGNAECGFRPQFNSLNLFSVPRLHSVTRVTGFAPVARAAISGWARETLEPPSSADTSNQQDP